MDIESLKKHMESVTEPQRESGNYRHKLLDIIVIALCTIIVGGEDFVDMENFGKERNEWLCGFLELDNEHTRQRHISPRI